MITILPTSSQVVTQIIPQCFHSYKTHTTLMYTLQFIAKSLIAAFVWLAARCWVSWCSNLEWVHITELVDALADSWATSWWWCDIEVLPQTTVSQQVDNRLWQNHWCRLLQWLVIINIVMGLWLSTFTHWYDNIMTQFEHITMAINCTCTSLAVTHDNTAWLPLYFTSTKGSVLVEDLETLKSR